MLPGAPGRAGCGANQGLGGGQAFNTTRAGTGRGRHGRSPSTRARCCPCARPRARELDPQRRDAQPGLPRERGQRWEQWVGRRRRPSADSPASRTALLPRPLRPLERRRKGGHLRLRTRHSRTGDTPGRRGTRLHRGPGAGGLVDCPRWDPPTTARISAPRVSTVPWTPSPVRPSHDGSPTHNCLGTPSKDLPESPETHPHPPDVLRLQSPPLQELGHNLPAHSALCVSSSLSDQAGGSVGTRFRTRHSTSLRLVCMPITVQIYRLDSTQADIWQETPSRRRLQPLSEHEET
ncbi:uncharacterized protein LOC123809583 [Phyllostomus hastatus]|uniref:uncharacterized protein LOC123809583 n=1 Tax=Phyllostomus hastatus TaxID=9423 RepID=UPI001E683EF7|nr:uncharacterized protein LOC123809583 [Phyllostomus hastatus]